MRELGLTYMVNQSRPHAGFPEAAFDKYSALAISLGYKIGRVEQTQTPKELDAANKQRGGKKTKIVERTLCSVLTPGTLTDIDLIGSHKSASLFALREKELSPAEIDALSQAGTLTALGATAVAEYGVCWVDCSIGAFTIGQFYDDAPRSQLATLLATVGPREVLIPKGGISDATRAIFRNELTPQCYKGLYEQPEPERFWTAEETYDWLSRQPYFRLFRLQPGGDEIPLEEAEEDWPPVLIQLTEARKDLAFSALGGLLWMLVWTKQAQQLLTRKDFTLYAPSAGGLHARSLILDNQTLINLEVMRDSEGGDRGSLLSYVDRCVSAMGHRLMKRWVSCPLGEVTAINDRLNAVQLLRDDDALRSACRQLLKELPDLERLMSSLHAYSLKKEKTEVMYGQQEQRKLAQMLQVLDGLDRAAEVRDRVFARVSRDSLNSVELAHCTLQFPNYADIVSEFRNVTDDWTQAVKQDGFITPRAGVVPAYDEACAAEQAAVEQLEAYLEEQREELRLRDLKYVHPNRDRYLLEVPVSRKVSSDYTVVSGTAKIKRYTTRALKEELLPALEQAELDKEKIGKDVTRMIYGKLASYNATWKRTVSALATLDCLCALAVVSADQNAQGVTCRPTFVPFDEGKGAQLELRQAIHPVLAANMPPGKGSTFIPNDTVLGCAECPAPIVLLSGPNMGGKVNLNTCHAITQPSLQHTRHRPSPDSLLSAVSSSPAAAAEYAAASGVHRGDPGAAGLLRAGRGGASDAGGSDLHALRCGRPADVGSVDVPGGDGGDRHHPPQRQPPLPGHPRRARPRHLHLRRRLHRLGRRRAPAPAHALPHPLLHALPHAAGRVRRHGGRGGRLPHALHGGCPGRRCRRPADGGLPLPVRARHLAQVVRHERGADGRRAALRRRARHGDQRGVRAAPHTRRAAPAHGGRAEDQGTAQQGGGAPHPHRSH